MPSGAPKPVEIFFSYAQQDQALRDELDKHLVLLERQGIVRSWHDRKIGAGEDWRAAIDRHMESAEVVLLLVSADFLASDYCFDVEVKRALEREKRGEATVIPVLLRQCDTRGAPFAHLTTLPRDGSAVTSHKNRDEAWTEVARGIRDAVEKRARGEGAAARVFLSYKRGGNVDEGLARSLAHVLGQHGHQVFLDQVLSPGTVWAARIEQEIASSDWFVVLLSETSAHSEMVRAEVEAARRAKAATGRPTILPIRVAFRAPFPYPLDVYLDGIQWAFWEPGMDPEALAEPIAHAIAGRDLPLPPPFDVKEGDTPSSLVPAASARPATVAATTRRARLEQPEEPVHPESPFYVARASDDEAKNALASDRAVTVTIKGSRQMGKTSLLNRVAFAARAAGKQVAYVDFKLFEPKTLADPRLLFEHFAAMVADELGVANELEPYWSRLPLPQACTKHVVEKLLRPLGARVLLAADELDHLFESTVRHEFFGMLRSWHESRSRKAELARLDMVLVTSTDPDRFTRDDTTYGSPFNVGTLIELADFSPSQVDELIGRHDLSLDLEQRRKLRQLFGGHPYLVRRALFLLASGQWSLGPEITVADLADPFGPFGDHLRQYLLQLQGAPELRRELLRALGGTPCSNPMIFDRLRGAGLLRGTRARPEPRCALYAAFFGKHLDA
jgi:hypothetical protein